MMYSNLLELLQDYLIIFGLGTAAFTNSKMLGHSESHFLFSEVAKSKYSFIIFGVAYEEIITGIKFFLWNCNGIDGSGVDAPCRIL